MRDLQNALSIFHLRNVGVPYNVGGALPNSGFSLSTPSPAFFHCSSLTADTMLSSKLYIFPGLASVPFHAFIVASFCKLQCKKRPPTRILMYSLGSLLYVALDVLPSTILFTGTTPFFPVNPSLNNTLPPHTPIRTHSYLPRSLLLPTDLSCACETEECMGDPLACKISRFSIFILMLGFFFFLCYLSSLCG